MPLYDEKVDVWRIPDTLETLLFDQPLAEAQSSWGSWANLKAGLRAVVMTVYTWTGKEPTVALSGFQGRFRMSDLSLPLPS